MISILISLFFLSTAQPSEILPCYDDQSLNISITEPSSKILLIPGAGARGEELYLGHIHWGKYFSELSLELERHNLQVEILPVALNGNDSLDKRIQRIRHYLINKKQRYILWGHSIGGLVSRLALKQKQVSKYVTAVVQMSSPNRGTEIADFVFKHDSRAHTINLISKVFGFPVQEKRYFKEMQTSRTADILQARDTDIPAPPIYSIVSYQPPEKMIKSIPALNITDAIMRPIIRVRTKEWGTLTDGIVPAYSQPWGECLFQVELNHGGIIGKTFLSKEHNIFKKLINKIVIELKNRNHIE